MTMELTKDEMREIHYFCHKLGCKVWFRPAGGIPEGGLGLVEYDHSLLLRCPVSSVTLDCVNINCSQDWEGVYFIVKPTPDEIQMYALLQQVTLL